MRTGNAITFLWLCVLVVPAGAQSRMAIQLDHAIRPAEGSAGALGRVVGMAVTNTGMLYVAERGPGRVALYDNSGRLVRVVVRDGEGPGEAHYPQVALQGDTLLVYDATLHRLMRFSAAGKLLAEMPTPGPGGWPETPLLVTRDGRIMFITDFVLTGSATAAFRTGNNNALTIAPGGRIDTVAWYRDATTDPPTSVKGPGWILRGIPLTHPGGDQIDYDGHVIIGSGASSRWQVLQGRDTVRTVALPDHPVPIPERVRDSVFTAWHARVAKSMPPALEAVKKELIPKFLPPWVTLSIDPTGAWWVGRPGPLGVLAAWDILVGDRAVGHVALPAPASERFMAFGRNFVALLHEDADAVPWIGVYRITR